MRLHIRSQLKQYKSDMYMWNYIYRNKIDELGLPDSRASKRLVAIYCVGGLITSFSVGGSLLVAFLVVLFVHYFCPDRPDRPELVRDIVRISCFVNSVGCIWFIYWLFKYYRGKYINRDYISIFLAFLGLAQQIIGYFMFFILPR